jgi:hypothetical protein
MRRGGAKYSAGVVNEAGKMPVVALLKRLRKKA